MCAAETAGADPEGAARKAGESQVGNRVRGAELRSRRRRWGGEWGKGFSLPSRVEIWGRVVSSHSEFLGRSPGQKQITVLFKRQRTPIVETFDLN